VIILFQPPPAFGMPCLSPFGTKVETYLRMVGLPYRTAMGDPRKGPKGKIPWIEDDGQVVADSGDIIDHLKARYGDPLDKDLTPAQRAVAHATRRMLEEHLYWVGMYARWLEDEGYRSTRVYFKRILPPVIGGLLLDRVVRKDIRKALHAQGLGRHNRDEIHRRGAEDIDALSVLLGSTPYFLGDHPTSIDATVFSLTLGALAPPGDVPLKQRVAGHANLAAYTERMNKRYFGDHPPGRSVDA
jgi:glutathione S-transferase